jgi:thiol-disulfide isomerase/thioredoxin
MKGYLELSMRTVLRQALLLGLLLILGWVAQPANAIGWSGLKVMQEMAREAVPYEVAIASSKPTLLEFYADWCSVCQSMASTVQTLEQQYGENINFVMLNVDDAQWLPQMDQYDVTGVPQFTLLDSQQASLKTVVGRIPEPVLVEIVETAI